MTGARSAADRLRLPLSLSAALFLALVPAACSDSSTDPGDDLPAWEGSLDPASEDVSTLEGTVTVTLDPEGGFDVEVWATGLPTGEDEGFPWTLRTGSCEEPGDPLVDATEVPPYQPDENGDWTAHVDVSLDDQAEGWVFDLRRSADDPEVAMGCADLVRED